MCLFQTVTFQDSSPNHKNLEYRLDQRYSIRYHIWDIETPWQLIDNGIGAIKTWKPTGESFDRFATKEEAIEVWRTMNRITQRRGAA